ncbi:MAG: beta-ACP synthase, partial [Campylobacter sp.]|nr:beta-ACP synthase [Campylobacter sp.]
MRSLVYLSPPCVFSPFGDENALFDACVSGKRALSMKNFLDKNMLVGSINLSLAEFGNHTKVVYKTRTNQILLSALLGMENEIFKMIKIYGAERIGVVIGTTTTGVEENFEAFDDGFRQDKFILQRNSLANPAEFVREFFELKSVAFGVSTACTSGIKAFECAKNFIELGICDVVICGGADSLNTLTLYGFNSLGVISNEPCKPFDKNRNGINIGEAAAVFLMCKDEISEYKLKAVGTNCDAFHITQPNPQASDQISLISSLLK